MTIILILVILALCGVVFYQFFYWRRLLNASREMLHEALLANIDLEEKGREKDRNYEALERGQQEIIDNYENDFLNFQVQIDGLKNGAVYDREMRDEAEKKLKLTNDVIDAHAGSCESILKEYVDAMMEEIQPKDG
jgi:hypothetical protein